jgi:hypothetical protein
LGDARQATESGAINDSVPISLERLTLVLLLAGGVSARDSRIEISVALLAPHATADGLRDTQATIAPNCYVAPVVEAGDCVTDGMTSEVATFFDGLMHLRWKHFAALTDGFEDCILHALAVFFAHGFAPF